MYFLTLILNIKRYPLDFSWFTLSFLNFCCLPAYFQLIILIGINCQKAARPAGPGGKMVEGDPYGDEALAFTKERCLQREVSFWLSKEL